MRYLLLTVLLASCTDLAQSGTDPDQPDLSEAQRAWLDRALPVLELNCIQCHGTQEPRFLDGGGAFAIRESLLASGVVDIVDPTRSRLLTKGAHSGPSLTAQQTSDLLEWLVAERN